MTKYERELKSFENALVYLPKSIRETKLRGARVKSIEKCVRKLTAKVETARRACETLPKHWTSYKPTKTGRGDRYARQEVSNLHIAISQLEREKDYLKRSKEAYAERFEDRRLHRQELRGLPEQITCLKALIEIAAKRKKPAKEKNKLDKWIEVTPGYFVEKHRIVTYCKTLPEEPIKNVSGGFYILSHHNGYAKFGMKQFHPGSVVECRA